MRLTSIQPYEKDGLDFFAATFERVVRTSDQKSDPDRSFCEISWSVELSEVANEVAQHAERGLHVEAFGRFQSFRSTAWQFCGATMLCPIAGSFGILRMSMPLPKRSI